MGDIVGESIQKLHCLLYMAFAESGLEGVGEVILCLTYINLIKKKERSEKSFYFLANFLFLFPICLHCEFLFSYFLAQLKAVSCAIPIDVV